MTPDLDLIGAPADAADAIRAGREADRSGQPVEARGHYERALRALGGSGQTRLAGTLYRWIAWTYANGGDPEAALDCLEVAEAAAEAAHDDRGLASVLNTRAGTLFNLGDLDQAEALFRRVRGLAWRTSDRKLHAMAEQNLGSVACIRGDLRLALGRFKSSLALYEMLGLKQYLGPLLNNIGRLQIDLMDDAEAAATLARARELCIERSDQHHLVVVHANRARLLLRRAELVPALTACNDARDLMTATGDDRWLGEVLLVTGAAQARLGKPEVSLDVLGRAAKVARDRRDAKVLADVLLEQAGVQRVLGRNRDTLLSLNEAHATFLRLRARRELADVDERLASLEAVFLEIVRSWGASIESKDAYTQGHSSRVAEIACLIAVAAGMPESELTWFRMGALLHDVGKVAVPDEVLKKKGPLDDAEWRLMALHPVTGVELLEGVEFAWDIKPMVRHHHERWDGTGYPDQLAGPAIPYSARLLTIADVYDALTTDRPYRAAFDHDAAMAIMESTVGKSLDPDLFAIFKEQVSPLLAARSAPPMIQPAAAPPALQIAG